MIIKSICLDNFGKFNNKTLEFTNGVNLLYGENEAGKTTLHTFIKGMLFGLDGKHGKNFENNEYEKYIPWENPDNYKGSMIIEADGVEYRIERNFLRSEKSCTITKISTGRELDRDEIEELFYGFDENCYYNTISISQLGSITSKELEKVLKNYTANLGSTKTTEIDIQDALNQLEDTKERLILEGGADQKEEIEEEITNINAELERLAIEEKEVVESVEANREEVVKLRTQVKALEELDNVQTERQIKKNINQENLLQRAEMLNADIEHLKSDRERSDKHQQELKTLLDSYGVSSKQEVEKEIEWLISKSNISIPCILVIVAALGLCAGIFFSGEEIVFSDYTTWIKEAICLGVAVLFGIIFVVVYFLKKRSKAKKVAMLKELKLSVDRYQAAKSEFAYADKQLRAKQKELNNVSFKVKAEETRPDDTSDYNSEIDEIKEKIAEYREEKTKLQFLLEQKKESGLKYKKQLEILKERLEKAKSIEIDLVAIEEAKKTIYDISDEVRRTFGKTLNQKASTYMGKITNGKYDKIAIDEEINITVESSLGINVPVEKLSKGTIEQIYMSLRLAAADIIFEDDRKPILLDDAFVMYDNKRMANTLKFMAENLEQVLVFSCHTREKVMADRLGIDYKLTLI